MEPLPTQEKPATPPRQDQGGVARGSSPSFTFPLISVYAATFLFSFHVALTSYIDSTFISSIFPSGVPTPLGTMHDGVGLIFAIGSLLTLITLAYAPRILRRIGNHNATLVFIVTEILLLAGIAYFKSALLSALLFAIHLAAFPLTRFSLDLFLESNSRDATTGTARGIFLTVGNLAWVLAPLLAGFLLTNGDYWKIYIASAALMIPVWYLVADRLHFFRDPSYEDTRFWKTAGVLFANKHLRRAFISDFLLWFFYAWMMIYTPLYLHEHIGFSWQSIGIIFTVMLLPFILFQYPLGRLADKRFGEKGMLVGGFLIMAFSTVLLGVSQALIVPVMIPWMIALFATRVGASTVEIMNETYFFKHIDGSSANLLGFFRNTAPLALLVAPLIATGIFMFRGAAGIADFRFLFVVLGIIMFLGVWNALLIEDGK